MDARSSKECRGNNRHAISERTLKRYIGHHPRRSYRADAGCTAKGRSAPVRAPRQVADRGREALRLLPLWLQTRSHPSLEVAVRWLKLDDRRHRSLSVGLSVSARQVTGGLNHTRQVDGCFRRLPSKDSMSRLDALRTRPRQAGREGGLVKARPSVCPCVYSGREVKRCLFLKAAPFGYAQRIAIGAARECQRQ